MTKITFTEDEKDELRRICSEPEFVEYSEALANELMTNPYHIEKLPEPGEVNSQLEQLGKDIDKCSKETKRHISNTYSMKTGHLTFDILFELQKCLAVRYKRGERGKPPRLFASKTIALLFDHYNLELNVQKNGALRKYLELIYKKTNSDELDIDLLELAKKIKSISKEAKQIQNQDS